MQRIQRKCWTRPYILYGLVQHFFWNLCKILVFCQHFVSRSLKNTGPGHTKVCPSPAFFYSQTQMSGKLPTFCCSIIQQIIETLLVWQKVYYIFVSRDFAGILWVKIFAVKRHIILIFIFFFSLELGFTCGFWF